MEPTTTTTDAAMRVHVSRGRPNVDADAAEAIDIGSALVQVKISSSEARGGFSLIEYEIPPRTLVAPLHRHTWEDEHSFVRAGRMAALLGDDLVYAEAGELVRKPRRLWHTVWNADDGPCRVLEIISPGGFEQFFAELASAIQGQLEDPIEPGELGARYGVDSDFDSVPWLCEQHGLDSPLIHASERVRGRQAGRSPT